MKTPYELFHVECGPGWEKLYRPLLDLAGLYGATVLQVKEKFGGLRFYFAGPPVGPDGVDRHAFLQAMADAAEDASFHTCEDCGEDAQVGWDDVKGKPVWKAQRRYGGWIRTLCEPCAVKAGYDIEEKP